MSGDCVMALPFSVSRAGSVPLWRQIADGIVSAVRSGYYSPGDRIPSIVEMAAALGTSETAVRQAVRHLADQGEVVARRKTGIMIPLSGRRAWRRHVLFVYLADTYYFTTRNRRLFELFEAARVRVTAILLGTHEKRLGLPKVTAVLETQPVDLVLLECREPALVAACEQRRIPFVSVVIEPHAPHACGVVEMDLGAAFGDMVRHCRACGVRSARLFVSSDQHVAALAKAFRGSGIDTTVANVKPGSDSHPLEAYEKEGWRGVQHLLADGLSSTDFIYFDDDYAARGGLTALLAAGIRPPDGVQVATWSNRGHCPVFPVSLSRVENDPAEHADIIAQLVQLRLDQPAAPSATVRVSPVFVVGETTRPAVPTV